MKKFIALLLVAVICLTSFAAFAAGDNIKVYLDGEQLAFDVEPQFVGEYVMVPIRPIFEALGATVEYDEKTETIEAFNEITTVSLAVGVPKISINGVEKNMDIAPVEVDGRTLISARFAAEAFGCDVIWEEATKSVFIKSHSVDTPYKAAFKKVTAGIKQKGTFDSSENCYSYECSYRYDLFKRKPSCPLNLVTLKYYPNTNIATMSYTSEINIVTLTLTENNFKVEFSSIPNNPRFSTEDAGTTFYYGDLKTATRDGITKAMDLFDAALVGEFDVSLSNMGIYVEIN